MHFFDDYINTEIDKHMSLHYHLNTIALIITDIL